ncbi:hypothetical protein A6R68_16865 [Neotoma lepida]|uniref:Nucleoporin NDC1 n=1 Tax=Neotoma lepida TaxID=56216 RepID=A0A1A6HDN4_NEOLE|nr:hypothetical protein A6R68_16865 [Neotoma lepida]
MCRIEIWTGLEDSYKYHLVGVASTCMHHSLYNLQQHRYTPSYTVAVSDLCSSRVIFYLLLLSVVIIIIIVPCVPGSRLALIGRLLHPQQLLHSFIHAAMGMVVAWCAAVITKGRYGFLVVSCTGTESLDSPAAQTCMNEYHLFFLLAGAFMGYSYSLLYFINNMNYLPFPIIQQYKFLRFRRSLFLLAKHSCVESLFVVRNFCIVYYFFGHIPRAWISTAMDLHTDEQAHRPLDTIGGLLNISLLYHVWLCGVFLLMTWYISWILFKIYATEAYVFPIQPPFAEESDECLPKVLNSNPPLIIKYLALQDLMLLSQYSPSRRQEVFSLSQPGGHPHNWTAISRECLNLLNDMTQKLVLYQEAAATNGRMSSSYSMEPKKLSSPEETTFQTPKSSQMPSMPPLVKTSLFSPKLPTPDVSNPLGTPFGSSVVNRMAGIFDIKNFLSKRVLIMYFFSKHPEASIQAVFSDAQMHIWALEGLSHLVAASFTEDRFGVVQTTLPAILNTLLTLQEVSGLSSSVGSLQALLHCPVLLFVSPGQKRNMVEMKILILFSPLGNYSLKENKNNNFTCLKFLQKLKEKAFGIPAQNYYFSLLPEIPLILTRHCCSSLEPSALKQLVSHLAGNHSRPNEKDGEALTLQAIQRARSGEMDIQRCFLLICIVFGRWQGINLFLHSVLVGEGVLKKQPSSCTKEDLREAKRRETFPLQTFTCNLQVQEDSVGFFVSLIFPELFIFKRGVSLEAKPSLLVSLKLGAVVVQVSLLLWENKHEPGSSAPLSGLLPTLPTAALASFSGHFLHDSWATIFRTDLMVSVSSLQSFFAFRTWSAPSPSVIWKSVQKPTRPAHPHKALPHAVFEKSIELGTQSAHCFAWLPAVADL